MTPPTEVDFHYDGMCPWAYQASKWMRDVRDQLGLTVNWRFFSLEEINRVDGKKHPWEREWSYGWSLMRIGALLRRTDMALVDAWYERTGRALEPIRVDPLARRARIGADVHDPIVRRWRRPAVGDESGQQEHGESAQQNLAHRG